MAQLKYIDAICFEVCGDPRPKERPRFTVKCKKMPNGKKRYYATVYTPNKTREYEERIQDAFIQSGHSKFPVETPLSVSVIFSVKVPGQRNNVRIPKKIQKMMIDGDILPTYVPDVDNLLKAVLDALNGLAYVDDSQVVQVWAFKKYAEIPRTTILIQEAKYVRHHKPEQKDF